MVSPHLLAERDRLLDEIDQMQRSGLVAPPNVWISPNFQTNGSKVYEYFKLTSENPKVTHQHLGIAGSRKYQTWAARISRRNTLQELKAQLALLEALIRRQETAGIVGTLD